MAELTEKQIGDQAAKMVKSKMKSEISSSGLHQEGNNDYSGQWRFPLSETTAVPRLRKKELNSIALVASKHLFVHHYGVEKTRKKHSVTRKGKTFTRSAHPFKLRSRNMIDDGVLNSGALEYLATELPALRADIVLDVFKLGLPNGKKES